MSITAIISHYYLINPFSRFFVQILYNKSQIKIISSLRWNNQDSNDNI